MEVLAQYGIAVPIFLAIDLAWIVVIARGFYKRQLGSLLADDVNWAAAIAFYLLFIVGIVVFALDPAKNAWQALGLGALFGLVSYATYDLTNLATTRGWPATLTAVDLAWGTTLSGSVSAATYLIYAAVS
jgi:uncharacterized membrane protein